MSESNTPSLLPERDYDAIEAAVMETERGRWFLAEYARRNRSADTGMLLTAIKQLEAALSDQQAVQPAKPQEEPASDQVRFDLMEMAATIAQTKLDIAAIVPRAGQESHFLNVASELDSIVTATETATYEILQGAEGIQELALSMRQKDIDPDLLKNLETRASEIFSACEFQDITGQRIAKVVQALNYIENRLNSMIGIWGDENLIAAAAMAPNLPTVDSPLQQDAPISQYDVDELMWTETESVNALEDAAARLEQLSIRAETESSWLNPDAAASAPRRKPLDIDAETVVGTPGKDEPDEAQAVTRKTLTELGQDKRTLLFS